MSSLEIAELTGKRHDNVMADIVKMLTELDILKTQGISIYRDSMNRKQECYNLDKRLSHILVAGYSIPHRAAIVDRWLQLESQAVQPQPSLPDFSKPWEAARAYADKSEALYLEERKNDQLKLELVKVEQKVAEQAPIVIEHELLTNQKLQGGMRFYLSVTR